MQNNVTSENKNISKKQSNLTPKQLEQEQKPKISIRQGIIKGRAEIN